MAKRGEGQVRVQLNPAHRPKSEPVPTTPPSKSKGPVKVSSGKKSAAASEEDSWSVPTTFRQFASSANLSAMKHGRGRGRGARASFSRRKSAADMQLTMLDADEFTEEAKLRAARPVSGTDVDDEVDVFVSDDDEEAKPSATGSSNRGPSEPTGSAVTAPRASASAPSLTTAASAPVMRAPPQSEAPVAPPSPPPPPPAAPANAPVDAPLAPPSEAPPEIAAIPPPPPMDSPPAVAPVPPPAGLAPDAIPMPPPLVAPPALAPVPPPPSDGASDEAVIMPPPTSGPPSAAPVPPPPSASAEAPIARSHSVGSAGAAAAAESSAPRHVGWLWKKGGGTSLFGRRNWKRRYFVLDRYGTLTYYKSDEAYEAGESAIKNVRVPLCAFLLDLNASAERKCIILRRLDDKSMASILEKMNSPASVEVRGYEINIPKRDYQLRADAADEGSDEWLELFKSCTQFDE